MSTTRFPHVLALLTTCIFIAAVLSYVLPAGRYDREHDEATGRDVVVAGTYHEVEALAIWIWGTMRHAVRTRVAPDLAEFDGQDSSDARSGGIIGLVLITLGVLAYGILRPMARSWPSSPPPGFATSGG